MLMLNKFGAFPDHNLRSVAARTVVESANLIGNKHKSTADVTRFLNRAASGTFLCRVFYLGSGYIITLVLTHWLGARGLGVYNYAISWVMLGTLVAKFGLEDYITREVSVARSRGKLNEAKGIWHAAKTAIASNSFILVLVSLCVVLLTGISDQDLRYSMYVGLGIIPLMSMLGLYRGWLRAAKRTMSSQLPEYLLRPLAFGSMVLLALLLDIAPNAYYAVAASLVATIGTAIFCLVTDPTRQELSAIPRDSRSTPRMLREAFPFLLIASVYLVNQKTDRIMLGSLSSMESVGLYSVAAQMAMLVGLPQQALASSISPVVVEQYHSGGIRNLEYLLIRYGIACAATAALICGLLIVLGPLLLSWFGTEFEGSYTALVILSIGYLANVSAGPVGIVLSMLHKERLVAYGVAISALVNIAANFFLIPKFGVDGAAVATALSMVVWNTLLTVFAKWYLGINVNYLARLVPKSPVLATE